MPHRPHAGHVNGLPYFKSPEFVLQQEMKEHGNVYVIYASWRKCFEAKVEPASLGLNS